MASVIENKNTAKRSRLTTEEQKQSEMQQQTAPTEKSSVELQQALKTIEQRDTTIAEMKLKLDAATRQNVALTQQVELLKKFYSSAEKMDATAEKMTASVNSKTSADELLREDLEIWSKEIGDNIADEIVKRVLRATDGALEKIDTQFCDQLDQQGETLKKVKNQPLIILYQYLVLVVQFRIKI